MFQQKIFSFQLNTRLSSTLKMYVKNIKLQNKLNSTNKNKKLIFDY